MATASLATIDYPHISQKADVCGGKATIDGTRVRVMDIVALHKRGMAPEQMLEYYSSRPLTLSEVHAALTYYYDHPDEIEASFAEDREWEADYELRKAEHLNRRAAR